MISKSAQTEGLFEQPRRRAEMVNLMKQLLVSMNFTETVKAIQKQTTNSVQNETFEAKLQRLQAASYRSEIEKRTTISKILEQQYISRIEKENIHQALDLLSNKMDKYCSNMERLSTYLLSLPKKQPKLLNIISPYFLKQKCPPLPKHKIMRAVFETDQVWIVKCNGKYIMSIDKQSNGKVFVEDPNQGWKVQAQKKALHKKIIFCVNWMKQNIVGTASEDTTAKLWSVTDLQCLHTINFHYGRVSSIVFTPESIITGGFDKIIIMDHAFNKKQQISSSKVYQMLVSSNGKTLFILTERNHQVNIINLQNVEEIGNIKQKQDITTMALSKNQKYLFLNTSYKKPQIHVWLIEKLQLVQKWSGHQQQKFVLRMQNGGPYGQFLAVGSENGEVLLFHISHATPIHRFNACRNKPVNCVSWIDENRLVECNDDRSVQIWSSKDNGGEITLIQQPVEQQRREPTREELIRLMMMPHTVFNNDDSDASA